MEGEPDSVSMRRPPPLTLTGPGSLCRSMAARASTLAISICATQAERRRCAARTSSRWVSGRPMRALCAWRDDDPALGRRRAHKAGRSRHAEGSPSGCTRDLASQDGNPADPNTASGTRKAASVHSRAMTVVQICTVGLQLNCAGAVGLVKVPTQWRPLQTSTADSAEAFKNAIASRIASASSLQSQLWTLTIWSSLSR